MQPDDPLAALPVSTEQPAKSRGCSWILLLLLLIPCALVMVAVVIIVILALLGPAIGNIFSNIVIGL